MLAERHLRKLASQPGIPEDEKQKHLAAADAEKRYYRGKVAFFLFCCCFADLMTSIIRSRRTQQVTELHKVTVKFIVDNFDLVLVECCIACLSLFLVIALLTQQSPSPLTVANVSCQ